MLKKNLYSKKKKKIISKKNENSIEVENIIKKKKKILNFFLFLYTNSSSSKRSVEQIQTQAKRRVKFTCKGANLTLFTFRWWGCERSHFRKIYKIIKKKNPDSRLGSN